MDEFWNRVPREVKDSMQKIKYFCESFPKCDERCPFYSDEYKMSCFFDQYMDPVDWRIKYNNENS